MESQKRLQLKQKELMKSLKNENHPGLVKIDVEGYEYQVIQDGLQTIKKDKPLMIIESFPPKHENITKTLSEIGYQIYDAGRMTSIQKKTCNLCAWHPAGPVSLSIIENFLGT